MEWYWAFAMLLGMIIFMMALGVPVAITFLTTNIIGWLFFNEWEKKTFDQRHFTFGNLYEYLVL